VTKGTIYFYFETKERVFDEMIRHFFVPVLAEADAILAAPSGASAERLGSFLRFIYTKFATDRKRRELLRVLVAEGKRFPGQVARYHAEFAAPAVQRVGELLEAGVAAGEFRPAPAIKFAELIISPAVLLGVWFLVIPGQNEIDVETFITAHIDLVLHGLIVKDPRA
jgi:AcrR family transcriptional regulator